MTQALARQVRFPWAMATSQDLHVPGTKGRLPRGSAALDAYMNRLFALASRDGDVSLMVSRVFNLIESPLALYTPRTAWRVLREPARAPLLGPVAPPDLPGAPETQRASFASIATASRRAAS